MGYLSCQSTHRVYPQRVGRSQQSGRLKGLSILLRPLSISSRGVESVLRVMGLPLDHTSVCRSAQVAGEQVRPMRRASLNQDGCKVKGAGSGLAYVQCSGDAVAPELTVDVQEGVTFDIEPLDEEDEEIFKGWLGLRPQLVGADVMTTDGQDAFEAAANDADVDH